jgi:hypothetical protein
MLGDKFPKSWAASAISMRPQSCEPSLGANARRRPLMISFGPIIGWLQVRVLSAPPRSLTQIRFPAVSGRTPGFPRHSRGPDRHFRSLLPVTADRRGKNAARSLARANPFPADFIPTGRDPFACRLRPVRIYGRRASAYWIAQLDQFEACVLGCATSVSWCDRNDLPCFFGPPLA